MVGGGLPLDNLFNLHLGWRTIGARPVQALQPAALNPGELKLLNRRCGGLRSSRLYQGFTPGHETLQGVGTIGRQNREIGLRQIGATHQIQG